MILIMMEFRLMKMRIQLLPSWIDAASEEPAI